MLMVKREQPSGPRHHILLALGDRDRPDWTAEWGRRLYYQLSAVFRALLVPGRHRGDDTLPASVQKWAEVSETHSTRWAGIAADTAQKVRPATGDLLAFGCRRRRTLLNGRLRRRALDLIPATPADVLVVPDVPGASAESLS
jgi:hypothetical protein